MDTFFRCFTFLLIVNIVSVLIDLDKSLSAVPEDRNQTLCLET